MRFTVFPSGKTDGFSSQINRLVCTQLNITTVTLGITLRYCRFFGDNITAATLIPTPSLPFHFSLQTPLNSFQPRYSSHCYPNLIPTILSPGLNYVGEVTGNTNTSSASSHAASPPHPIPPHPSLPLPPPNGSSFMLVIGYSCCSDSCHTYYTWIEGMGN
uniref:Uncharacterized protein n=1 Tax=Cacopsylla melanoneura TaxID=428564 RepID=A0A8D8Z2J8_9HEMI